MYKRIIDDTFEQSQVTFEEEGINQQTLDELRAVGLPCSLQPSTWQVHCQSQLGIVPKSLPHRFHVCSFLENEFGGFGTVVHICVTGRQHRSLAGH